MAFVGLAAPELVVGAVEIVQGPKHSKTLREPQMRSTRGNLDTEIITILKFHINIFWVYIHPSASLINMTLYISAARRRKLANFNQFQNKQFPSKTYNIYIYKQTCPMD